MQSHEFRLGYHQCRDALTARLAEPAPSRIQLLTGPRQVGKTTLLLEIARAWGDDAIYAAADGPEAALPGFWDRLWERAESRALADGRAVVLIDEAHVIPGWGARLKAEWDRLRRRKLPVHIVATGSSALRLGAGSRESLAGRFERLTLAHWSARSLAETFGINPLDAAHFVVTIGAYPGAFPLRNDIRRYLAYVRDAILEPAIGRDMLALGAVRKPALLRQVFGVAASSPAQIVSLQKMQGRLQDSGALETIAHYLSLLEDGFLVAPLTKESVRAARQRAAPPKLVTLNNAFLAAFDLRGNPSAEADPARFGAWVENACLAFAWNSGQRVSYWREEPHEVDGVMEGSWGMWAVEIKTGAITAADLSGLAEFTRRFRRFRPLVLADHAAARTAAKLGFETMPWDEFLLDGTPR